MGKRLFRRPALVFLPEPGDVFAQTMLARLISAPLARWDEPNLRFQDAMNRLVPWLWWPLRVPAATAPMPPASHGLYVVHAYVIARAVRLPRRAPWALATLLSWAAFTGAWNRRAN